MESNFKNVEKKGIWISSDWFRQIFNMVSDGVYISQSDLKFLNDMEEKFDKNKQYLSYEYGRMNRIRNKLRARYKSMMEKEGNE